MLVRKCQAPGCEHTFVVGARNAHQKYHCRSCGEADRKRWMKPERQQYMRGYMRDYMIGYVRPEDRANDDEAAPSAMVAGQDIESGSEPAEHETALVESPILTSHHLPHPAPGPRSPIKAPNAPQPYDDEASGHVLLSRKKRLVKSQGPKD